MNLLVGFSGFVGSNIASQFTFDGLFNSKNIREAYYSKPDLLVYSGLKAEKFLANKFPQNDYEDSISAIENIEKINPIRIVLISTIDVYHKYIDVDEDTKINKDQLEPYGFHRLLVEEWVEHHFSNSLIVRLPALFGKNLKKNFIYDMINIIPTFLSEEKYLYLIQKDHRITHFYFKNTEKLYKCREITGLEKEMLISIFSGLDFNALNFTDSRASYQFYNLAYIWKHITVALSEGIKKINLAVEPIRVDQLYEFIYKKEFKNEFSINPISYCFRTKFDKKFKGSQGFIFDKSLVLEDIKEFVSNYSA